MTTIELRVGNWINEEPIGVRQWVNSDFVNYTGYDGRDENYISDKINPIPLTPEILEKAGFSKDDDLEFLFGRSIKNVQYVHQLQNLYFALTGNELEINIL